MPSLAPPVPAPMSDADLWDGYVVRLYSLINNFIRELAVSQFAVYWHGGVPVPESPEVVSRDAKGC